MSNIRGRVILRLRADAGDVYDVNGIGNFLIEPILDSDIDICHHVPTFRSAEKNIIIRFTVCSKRDKILQKWKKQRRTRKDLDYGRRSSPVYVNVNVNVRK